MKVIFFGTPEFVVSIPQALLKTANCKLLAVVTQPDKPAGRKQISTPSPVKSWAQEHKIKVINSDIMIRIIRAVKDLTPDVCILAAYGKILPPELLAIPKYGFLNVHPSPLPAYRGASPVQAAILNGEKETGVTIIKMDEKVDHGPIISQFKEEILPNDTTGTLRERLFKKAAEVLVTILPAWVEGRIKPREQNHQKATYTWLLKKEDGKIDWKWKPEKIESFIRAMDPWPGAWTEIEIRNQELGISKKRLKILKAHLEKQPIPNSQYPISKLIIDQVQLEGKKPVSWQQFQKGYPKVKFTS